MRELNERIKNITIPDKMRHLPIDERGFPVPKFVPWIDGKPEFRGMDGRHLKECITHKRCWLCGQPLGVHMVFVIGPMCAVNRNTSEPPCHHSCAMYAVQACPFLTQPKMRRNEKDMPEGDVAGLMIKRNPGVTVLWTTRSYKVVKDTGGAGVLFRIGDPEEIKYFSQGRQATHEEIMESINSGMPILWEHAKQDGIAALAELNKMYDEAMKLVPAA
jgi:hypothetical protein